MSLQGATLQLRLRLTGRWEPSPGMGCRGGSCSSSLWLPPGSEPPHGAREAGEGQTPFKRKSNKTAVCVSHKTAMCVSHKSAVCVSHKSAVCRPADAAAHTAPWSPVAPAGSARGRSHPCRRLPQRWGSACRVPRPGLVLPVCGCDSGKSHPQLLSRLTQLREPSPRLREELTWAGQHAWRRRPSRQQQMRRQTFHVGNAVPRHQAVSSPTARGTSRSAEITEM